MRQVEKIAQINDLWLSPSGPWEHSTKERHTIIVTAFNPPSGSSVRHRHDGLVRRDTPLGRVLSIKLSETRCNAAANSQISPSRTCRRSD